MISVGEKAFDFNIFKNNYKSVMEGPAGVVPQAPLCCVTLKFSFCQNESGILDARKSSAIEYKRGYKIQIKNKK